MAQQSYRETQDEWARQAPNHFCTEEEARASIPLALPFRPSGAQPVAFNSSTGHQIPCDDVLLAAGYVAGSARKFPQWKFSLHMGVERIHASLIAPGIASKEGAGSRVIVSE